MAISNHFHHNRELRRFGRFLIVGASGTVIDFTNQYWTFRVAAETVNSDR